MWLHAPLDPFCSCQPFQHRWWCHGAVDFGALKVMFVVCRSQATSQEIKSVVEASPGYCLLCTAASICTGTWCTCTWGEEGKVHGQPHLQRAQCACGGEHHSAAFSPCTALNVVIWWWGSASFGVGCLWGPAPKPSPAAAPAHASPCGPCIPACCWASLSLHGSPILSLPGIPTARLVPSWLLLLLKSSCAKALCRGCRFGLP